MVLKKVVCYGWVHNKYYIELSKLESRRLEK